MANKSEGTVLIFSGPPGVGKDTLVNILTKEQGFEKLTSYTTRQKRPDDKDGDYFYLTKEDYFKRLKENEFIDSNPVLIHGFYYGLSAKDLKKLLSENKIVVSNLAGETPFLVKKLFPEETILIFILPPSGRDLINRMHKRGVDKHDALKRIKEYEKFMHFALRYDLIIVNKDDKQNIAIKEILKFLKNFKDV